jgi:hypothetical protein
MVHRGPVKQGKHLSTFYGVTYRIVTELIWWLNHHSALISATAKGSDGQFAPAHLPAFTLEEGVCN